MTDAERFLWKYIRKRQLEGYRFRRQYPIGVYIVDFVCLDQKLIIELDGSQHQNNNEYDTTRSQYLELQGFKIIRFWNNQVLNEIEGVLETIYIFLKE